MNCKRTSVSIHGRDRRKRETAGQRIKLSGSFRLQAHLLLPRATGQAALRVGGDTVEYTQLGGRHRGIYSIRGVVEYTQFSGELDFFTGLIYLKYCSGLK